MGRGEICLVVLRPLTQALSNRRGKRSLTLGGYFIDLERVSKIWLERVSKNLNDPGSNKVSNTVM
jgi:hypothetical protein